jgi:hypothetical protein
MSSEETIPTTRDLFDALSFHFIKNEFFVPKEEEVKEIAIWLRQKCKEENITDPEEALDKHAEEIVKRITELVIKNRKETLKVWIERLKQKLDNMYNNLGDQNFIVCEGLLEETFLDLVEKAIDEAI